VVSAHQNNVIGAVVKDKVPWDEVDTIKQGTPKALCVWGIVHYEDMFGGLHFTKFGQILTWLRDGKTQGTAKLSALEERPVSTTVTSSVPGAATSPAGIAAVSRFGFTKAVGCVAPFQ